MKMTTDERLRQLEADGRRVTDILRVILQTENYLGDVLEMVVDKLGGQDDRSN